MTIEIQLRDVVESDFAIFFELQRDAFASRMAAFGTKDPDASELAARWKRHLEETSTTQRAIVQEGNVVGFVASFLRENQLEITYWIARTHWGRGIATAALAEFLRDITTRPVHASAAKET